MNYLFILCTFYNLQNLNLIRKDNFFTNWSRNHHIFVYFESKKAIKNPNGSLKYKKLS